MYAGFCARSNACIFFPSVIPSMQAVGRVRGLNERWSCLAPLRPAMSRHSLSEGKARHIKPRDGRTHPHMNPLLAASNEGSHCLHCAPPEGRPPNGHVLSHCVAAPSRPHLDRCLLLPSVSRPAQHHSSPLPPRHPAPGCGLQRSIPQSLLGKRRPTGRTP